MRVVQRLASSLQQQPTGQPIPPTPQIDDGEDDMLADGPVPSKAPASSMPPPAGVAAAAGCLVEQRRVAGRWLVAGGCLCKLLGWAAVPDAMQTCGVAC